MPRLVLVLVALLVLPDSAGAIPAFARRYKTTCRMCHNPVPALTAFGEQFAGNGFRFAPGELPADTLRTGDPLLTLLQEVPIAFRLDAYVQEFTDGNAVTDFQTPYSLKLLSSAPISKTLSYYFYAFLYERGEVGGVEDAFVTVNDIGGAAVDLSVGQFQLSDPLFKRELRLEFEDYAVYRARMGESPVDLTYDRGLVATADVLGFTFTGQVVNGNGRGAAQANRRFDSDFGKNVALHLTRDLASGLRVGGFAYTGRTTSDGIRNRTDMLGVDATLSRGPLELNLQYLHRDDALPTFLAGSRATNMDGGFAELLVRPRDSRWHGFALYNAVTADSPLLSLRLGEAEPLSRYETVTGGVGYLVRRNFRVTGEATHDLELGGVRWSLGFVSAF
jgi:hypothetical protein